MHFCCPSVAKLKLRRRLADLPAHCSLTPPPPPPPLRAPLLPGVLQARRRSAAWPTCLLRAKWLGPG